MNEEGVEPRVEEERLKAILESLLFAAGEPVGLTQLANALEGVMLLGRYLIIAAGVWWGPVIRG